MKPKLWTWTHHMPRVFPFFSPPLSKFFVGSPSPSAVERALPFCRGTPVPPRFSLVGDAGSFLTTFSPTLPSWMRASHPATPSFPDAASQASPSKVAPRKTEAGAAWTSPLRENFERAPLGNLFPIFFGSLSVFPPSVDLFVREELY